MPNDLSCFGLHRHNPFFLLSYLQGLEDLCRSIFIGVEEKCHRRFYHDPHVCCRVSCFLVIFVREPDEPSWDQEGEIGERGMSDSSCKRSVSVCVANALNGSTYRQQKAGQRVSNALRQTLHFIKVILPLPVTSYAELIIYQITCSHLRKLLGVDDQTRHGDWHVELADVDLRARSPSSQ